MPKNDLELFRKLIDNSHILTRINEPHAVAIVGATMIEESLGDALARVLHIDDNADARKRLIEGSIRNFNPRIEIGYALDLFGPDTLHDLRIIQSIRNKFAHHSIVSDDDKGFTMLSFESTDIVEDCDKLKTAIRLAQKMDSVLYASIKDALKTTEHQNSIPNLAMLKYKATCSFISSSLRLEKYPLSNVHRIDRMLR